MDLPDYQGGSIVNLMASLQMGLGGDVHDYLPLRQLAPDIVREYRQVVLWVIDGLGYDYLLAHPEAKNLNAALQDRITSVYPPTTASAVTTFLTGDAPQQHGLTGWYVYFKELGAILSVLPGRSRFGGSGYGPAGVDAASLLQHTPFADRIGVESHNLLPKYISDSPFSLAHLGAAQGTGYSTLQDLCDKTLEIGRRPGRRYIYLYWPELDSIGHHSGMGSGEAQRHLMELDQAFLQLTKGLKGSDTLLIVCADHGQVDSSPGQTLIVNDYPELSDCLLMPLCGEPRSAYCYLRNGEQVRFDEALAQLPEGLVTSIPSTSLIEDNWFGLGEPHARLPERIGDRVLLMHGEGAIFDWLPHEKPYSMIGVHGGLSSDELWVPLVVAPC
jgi:hypothetical protein